MVLVQGTAVAACVLARGCMWGECRVLEGVAASRWPEQQFLRCNTDPGQRPRD